MKKLILVFVAIAITAGAYTQSDATNRQTSPQDKSTQKQNVQNKRQDLNTNQNPNFQNNPQNLNTNQNPNVQNKRQDLNNNQNQNMQNNTADKSRTDGVIMQNGKMMKVKNGQMTDFQDQDVTLSNGTKIMRDGTYTKKDGTKMTLKEGQHMDMSGNMIPMKTDKNKNMDVVPK